MEAPAGEEKATYEGLGVGETLLDLECKRGKGVSVRMLCR